MEARKTSRDMPPADAADAPAAGGRARMATPAPVRPIRWIRRPGPETLASVLEPTPGPEALSPEALASTLEPPPTRSVAIRAHRPRKARNFLIGAAIGIVLLGAIVGLAKKNAPNAPAPQAPPAATQTP